MEKLKIDPKTALTRFENTRGAETLPKRKLSKKAFDQGMQMLCLVLPNLSKEASQFMAIESLLADLSDEEFLRGVRAICIGEEEIYPNTNLVAKIRNRGKVMSPMPRHFILDLLPPDPQERERINQARIEAKRKVLGV